MNRLLAPFTESALAPVRKTTQRNKALWNEWSVLEGGGEDAILMRENNRGGEIGRFLRGMITHDAI